MIRPRETFIDDVAAAGRLQAGSGLVTGFAFVRLRQSSELCVTEVRLAPLAAAALADVPELHRAGATTTATVIGLRDERPPDSIVEAQQKHLC